MANAYPSDSDDVARGRIRVALDAAEQIGAIFDELLAKAETLDDPDNIRIYSVVRALVSRGRLLASAQRTALGQETINAVQIAELEQVNRGVAAPA